MQISEIKAFQKWVGHAAWNLNLDAFAERIGSSPEHEYTRSKFREFTELNRSLSRFDAETLGRIINEPVIDADPV
jgi:hypothetical protein